jgi:HK97 family phage prohead protease
MSDQTTRPPRDNLVRACYPGVELRAREDDAAGMPVLTGELAVFNQPTEIQSIREGRFIEIMEPGSFAKTIQENLKRFRILFQHGQDPVIGDKPLAPIEELEQDDERVRYAGQMLDTGYNREIIPGLQAGLYGSSFRFDVVADKWDHSPEARDYNPEGLPERRVKEVRLHEFGPVTFPAYIGAGAGLRSMTDDYDLRRFASDPQKLRMLLESVAPNALPSKEPAPTTPTEGSRKVYPSITREQFLEKIHG